eukprot:TRINITY_DN15380_c0_g1_i2.p4 TRINITY_DN15380_c0_g1~~TRINITY_DN15380_c0_g1_i2.p4  ORF type:complete len:149 (+),score=32.33 TRINITY_DN15380_c0_g1_i2:727-1173(+)
MSLTIVVSGGSRGLGFEICSNLLEHGANVASFARKETKEILLLKEKYGDRYIFCTVEITNQEEVKNFVLNVTKEFGEINGLINNAAIGQDHLLSHISNENIGKIIEVNLTSTITHVLCVCLLYTSDAADDMQCVDLGGRRILKKKKNQ